MKPVLTFLLFSLFFIPSLFSQEMEEYEDIDVTKTEQFTLEKKEGEFGSYEVGEHFIYITKIHAMCV